MPYQVSHKIKPHIEYFHIVQATALRMLAGMRKCGSPQRISSETEHMNSLLPLWCLQ